MVYLGQSPIYLISIKFGMLTEVDPEMGIGYVAKKHSHPETQQGEFPVGSLLTLLYFFKLAYMCVMQRKTSTHLHISLAQSVIYVERSARFSNSTGPVSFIQFFM